MTNTTVTVKISGSLLHPDDVATLAHALQEAPEGCNILLVHGGGPQITRALERHHDPILYRHGLRVTTRDQANIVQATLDRTGTNLATHLQRHGVHAQHVSSIEQRLVAKPKRPTDGTELGRVGTPLSFRTQRLRPDGAIPVITPVGTDATGPLNVNADEAATLIANATDSDRLLLVTRVPGVLDEQGSLLETLTPENATTLIQEGTADGGMQPKLAAAQRALQNGVQTVHVTSLSKDLLSPSTPGTRITTTPEVPAG